MLRFEEKTATTTAATYKSIVIEMVNSNISSFSRNWHVIVFLLHFCDSFSLIWDIPLCSSGPTTEKKKEKKKKRNSGEHHAGIVEIQNNNTNNTSEWVAAAAKINRTGSTFNFCRQSVYSLQSINTYSNSLLSLPQFMWMCAEKTKRHANIHHNYFRYSLFTCVFILSECFRSPPIYWTEYFNLYKQPSYADVKKNTF